MNTTKFYLVIAVLVVALVGVGFYAVTLNSSASDSDAEIAALQDKVGAAETATADAEQETLDAFAEATAAQRQAYIDGLVYADDAWIVALLDFGDQLKAAGYNDLAQYVYAWAKEVAYTKAQLKNEADDYMGPTPI